MEFINSKAKKLARKLHKEEHLIVEGKIDKKHKLSEWYYLMASGIFENLNKKIEETSVDTYNLVIDLVKEIKNLKKEMKEVSKQQKYLWQTLDDLKEKK